MSDGSLVLLALSVVIALFYWAYVAMLVASADFYSKQQKVAQILLAFFIPVLGAIVVHWMYRLYRAPEGKPARGFVPEENIESTTDRAARKPERNVLREESTETTGGAPQSPD